MTGAPADTAPQWLWLHEADNVAMALADFAAGTALELGHGRITLADAVEYGHKFAVRPIAAGQPVIKFDETIGVASRDIVAGAHVHVHNVRSLRGGASDA